MNHTRWFIFLRRFFLFRRLLRRRSPELFPHPFASRHSQAFAATSVILLGLFLFIIIVIGGGIIVSKATFDVGLRREQEDL